MVHHGDEEGSCLTGPSLSTGHQIATFEADRDTILLHRSGTLIAAARKVFCKRLLDLEGGERGSRLTVRDDLHGNRLVVVERNALLVVAHSEQLLNLFFVVVIATEARGTSDTNNSVGVRLCWGSRLLLMIVTTLVLTLRLLLALLIAQRLDLLIVALGATAVLRTAFTTVEITRGTIVATRATFSCRRGICMSSRWGLRIVRHAEGTIVLLLLIVVRATATSATTTTATVPTAALWIVPAEAVVATALLAFVILGRSSGGVIVKLRIVVATTTTSSATTSATPATTTATATEPFAFLEAPFIVVVLLRGIRAERRATGFAVLTGLLLLLLGTVVVAEVWRVVESPLLVILATTTTTVTTPTTAVLRALLERVLITRLAATVICATAAIVSF